MKVSKETLNDMADNLEAGFKCYIHRKTSEIIEVPDKDRSPDIDTDAWEEDIEKVFKDRKNYIEIKGMHSSDSFRVMEDFVLSLENSSVKTQLIHAIEGRKPFANFNHQIDNALDYRERWFNFRRDRNIDWVQKQLDFESRPAF
jgi:hypothetical protein